MNYSAFIIDFPPHFSFSVYVFFLMTWIVFTMILSEDFGGFPIFRGLLYTLITYTLLIAVFMIITFIFAL